jgi:hypothetical protein
MASTSSKPQVPEASAFPDGTKEYKPLRSSKQDMRKPHITEFPITASNWYKHVNWLNTTFIVFVPVLGCISAYWTPLHLKTALFAIFYYFNTGLGITAGTYLSGLLYRVFVRGLYQEANLKHRLPSTLGSHVLQGHPSPQDISGCRGLGSC